MTLVILGLNIVGYILCTQIGEVVYNVGSINAERIFDGKQYYRFVTSMFLHADAEHIVSNMIFLVGLGQMIEQTIGHFRFTVLYQFVSYNFLLIQNCKEITLQGRTDMVSNIQVKKHKHSELC